MTRWLARLSVLAVVVLLGIPAADAGLHGYWPLDGDVTDATGTNDGTFSGGTATYVADRNGSPGSALQFDGTNDKVTVGTTGRPIDNFTYSAWIQTSLLHEIDPEAASGVRGVSSQDVPQKYAFGAQNASDTTKAGSGMSIGTNGISVYEHTSSYMPPLAVFDPGDTTTVGSAWNHVAIVYNDRRPSIYLNGALVHTGLQSPKAEVRSPVEFGSGSYGALDGLMDDVAIWDHALSAAQVQRLAAGVSPPDSGAVLINPSFEADTFTVYPGYISGNGPITGWTENNSARAGINPASGSPFANTGTVPDGSQVAFLQCSSTTVTLSQAAIGFEPGAQYMVTYRENARTGADPAVWVDLAGQTVVPSHTVPEVGGSNPYRYIGSKVVTVPTPTTDLTFTAQHPTADSTALIDDVGIHRMYLKFSDNYNTLANTSNINPNPANDDPGRQGGQFAPLTYAETNAADSQIAADRLLIAGTGINMVSPNRSFNLNGPAPAHFVLEFEVDPGTATRDHWAAVVFGSSTQTASVNSSDGIGMLFRDAGGYEIYDGTSANHSIKGGTLPGAGGAYDVRINYFVPGFDDVTPGMVNIWVNDAFVHSFITDSGFANNYINLIGYSQDAMDPWHAFDDLRIYSSYVPEPATLTLLALGGLGLIVRRRRR